MWRLTLQDSFASSIAESKFWTKIGENLTKSAGTSYIYSVLWTSIGAQFMLSGFTMLGGYHYR